MAKKRDICEECGGEMGEDDVCTECGWSREGENSEEEEPEEEEEEEF